MNTHEFSLLPKPTKPDPVADAIARLKEDPGAVFEEPVLSILRQVRKSDPPRWARYRQAIKATGVVLMDDLERCTFSGDKPAGDDEIFPAVTIWPEAVNGAELLDEISATISKHVIADVATVHAAALWAAFTWFADVVEVAPIANITAPEKRCGKTVMLSILARLVCRPLTVANIAPAALFRAIQLWSPTLLIDEVDAFLSEHDEARGILNAGFTRDSAYVVRCTGDDHTPTRFSVWGAKALCGIGKIADTLADRSIPLRLRRKLPGERTLKIRHADPASFAELVSKLARFAIDHRDSISAIRPTELDGLNDRANDCWEPLLAVAALAGGGWPERARAAAVALHGLEEDTPSIGAELLESIREVFLSSRVDRISTADLLEALAEDEEAPWAAWNRGKPMTPHQLAKRLAEFRIKPTTQRIGSTTAKGYKREQFEEAFKRYLCADHPQTSVTPLQPSGHEAYSDFQSVTIEAAVTDQIPLKSSKDAGCNGVTSLVAVPAEGAIDAADAEIFYWPPSTACYSRDSAYRSAEMA